MSVAVRFPRLFRVIPSSVYLLPGVRPYHGVFGLLWWADAECVVGCRHFWLVFDPHQGSTVQATFFQYLARELNWATRTPRLNHDIRSSEQLLPPAEVGGVPHLLLCSDHDGQRCRGDPWTGLERVDGSMRSSFTHFIALDA